jgi:peptidoglycan/LPS O-acetylase OafA/YrhL
MFTTVHGTSYALDTVAFGFSLIPFVLILALIVASFVEEPLRMRATVRAQRVAKRPGRSRPRLALGQDVASPKNV